jgi:hypothetical protein
MARVMFPERNALRDRCGFRVGDVIRCPSGRSAIVTDLRRDGKLDAEYEDGDPVILDPLNCTHAQGRGP